MGCNIYAENTQCLDAKRRLERKDGFARIRESVLSWISKFAIMKIDTVLKLWSNLSVSRPNSLLGLNRERNWQVRDGIDGDQGGGRAYSFGENCCRSKTTTEARSDGVLFLSLYMRESGSTTLLRNMTMIASRCQKPWYDNYDTVNQFIEKKMEQYDSMIFWRNSRKRKSMVLRSGHLTIGYLFWPKEEEPRNGFNIGWIQTLPTTSCTLEQVKDIQEVMLWILSCKTVHCYQKDLLSTSTTSGMQVKWIP